MSQTHRGPNRGSPPSPPRWVKVFVIIVIILVLMAVIMIFTGIGGEPTPPIEHGAQQP